MFSALQTRLTSWLFSPTKMEFSKPNLANFDVISSEGQYCGWRLRNPDNRTHSVVYFMHGNSGCAMDYFSFFEHRFTGCDIVCVEYPGFGWNHERTPTIEGCAEHVRQIYNGFIRQHYSNIYLVAYSIGTVIAARAFEYTIMENIRGVTLVSPIDDINQVVSDNTYIPVTVVKLLLGTEPTALFWKHIVEFLPAGVKLQVLIGSLDQVVKPERSLSLIRAMPESRVTVSLHPVGHNDLLDFI